MSSSIRVTSQEYVPLASVVGAKRPAFDIFKLNDRTAVWLLTDDAMTNCFSGERSTRQSGGGSGVAYPTHLFHSSGTTAPSPEPPVESAADFHRTNTSVAGPVTSVINVTKASNPAPRRSSRSLIPRANVRRENWSRSTITSQLSTFGSHSVKPIWDQGGDVTVWSKKVLQEASLLYWHPIARFDCTIDSGGYVSSLLSSASRRIENHRRTEGIPGRNKARVIAIILQVIIQFHTTLRTEAHWNGLNKNRRNISDTSFGRCTEEVLAPNNRTSIIDWRAVGANVGEVASGRNHRETMSTASRYRKVNDPRH